MYSNICNVHLCLVVYVHVVCYQFDLLTIRRWEEKSALVQRVKCLIHDQVSLYFEFRFLYYFLSLFLFLLCVGTFYENKLWIYARKAILWHFVSTYDCKSGWVLVSQFVRYMNCNCRLRS